MPQKYPITLPRCEYPTAADKMNHGFFDLPDLIQNINWKKVEKYRSQSYIPQSLSLLSKEQILDMAKMVADSFVRNEPMKRHLQPPLVKPKSIREKEHVDPFGSQRFGDWSSKNIIYWFIRLFVLTNPTDPIGNIKINNELDKLSIAIIADDLRIIGGAFNITIPPKEELLRPLDPFLDAVLLGDKPIFDFIFKQEHEVIDALKKKFSDFYEAIHNNQVGLHFMIARSLELPSEHTFELVASSAEKFQNLGYKYLLTCATNQWTGAAFEAMGSTRVHFEPYRTKQRVATRENAAPDEAYTQDGYISNKDSGAMFYIVKLN